MGDGRQNVFFMQSPEEWRVIWFNEDCMSGMFIGVKEYLSMTWSY